MGTNIENNKTTISALPRVTSPEGVDVPGVKSGSTVKVSLDTLATKEEMEALSAMSTAAEFTTYAIMAATVNPTSDITGTALGKGQLVLVTSDTDTTKNGIYRFKGLTTGNVGIYSFVKALGDLDIYALKGGSSKTMQEMDNGKLDKGLFTGTASELNAASTFSSGLWSDYEISGFTHSGKLLYNDYVVEGTISGVRIAHNRNDEIDSAIVKLNLESGTYSVIKNIPWNSFPDKSVVSITFDEPILLNRNERIGMTGSSCLVQSSVLNPIIDLYVFENGISTINYDWVFCLDLIAPSSPVLINNSIKNIYAKIKESNDLIDEVSHNVELGHLKPTIYSDILNRAGIESFVDVAPNSFSRWANNAAMTHGRTPIVAFLLKPVGTEATLGIFSLKDSSFKDVLTLSGLTPGVVQLVKIAAPLYLEEFERISVNAMEIYYKNNGDPESYISDAIEIVMATGIPHLSPSNTAIIPLTDESLLKGNGAVLYDKIFNEKTIFPVLSGAVGYYSDGAHITGYVEHGCYYAISERLVRYHVKFNNNTVARFQSDTGDFYADVDAANKTLAITSIGVSKSIPFLSPSHDYIVEVYRNFGLSGIRIVDAMTGDSDFIERRNDGHGGAGSGWINPGGLNIGQQHDKYCLSATNGLYLHRMTVLADKSDVDLYVIGDSISEPEGYYPLVDFPYSWTQLLKSAVEAKGQKILFSARGGGNINDVLERIKNELP